MSEIVDNAYKFGCGRYVCGFGVLEQVGQEVKRVAKKVFLVGGKTAISLTKERLIAGFENGIFPGIQSMTDPAELEEERRLAYVAITRAKEQLYLTHARERMLFGRTQYNPVSRFADEIPESLIETVAEQKKATGNFEVPTFIKKPANAVKETTIFDQKPKKEPSTALQPGTQVIHAAFGKGEILSARPMGNDVLYEVAFEQVGTKKLMGAYAKLKVAQ